MSEVIESIPLKNGNILQIVPDDDPQNPRSEYDNFGSMVCFHRRYSLGDKTTLRSGDFNSWSDLKNHLVRREKAVLILPIFMYDHSGITISTSQTGQYADRWDSGQIGFIYATKEKIRKEFLIKRVTKKTLKNAEKILLSEVEIYDQYLTGNVYGYFVKDKAGEIIDSCFGFYGDMDYIKEEFKGEIAL
jgi:hypothetical protein